MVSNTSGNEIRIVKIHPSLPPKPKTKKEPTKKHQKNQLLKFIQYIIESGKHSNVVRWNNEEKTELQFLQKQEFAEMYGAFIGRQLKGFDEVARHFRHYRAKGIVSKVDGSQSTWRFLRPPSELIEGSPVLQSDCSSSVSPVSSKSPAPGATPEELELIMDLLKANLAPFDKFLEENKGIKKYHFQKQIDFYINWSANSKIQRKLDLLN